MLHVADEIEEGRPTGERRDLFACNPVQGRRTRLTLDKMSWGFGVCRTRATRRIISVTLNVTTEHSKANIGDPEGKEVDGDPGAYLKLSLRESLFFRR